MMQEKLSFRTATKGDAGLLLRFIKDLAIYEKRLDEVAATEEDLMDCLFVRRIAEAQFVLANGVEVGYAFYYYRYSTFLGKPSLYLEDLFVQPEHRGRGCGKKLLRHLAALAVERGCGMMEWHCLDWNRPSIDFYLSLGAEPRAEWVPYRLSGAPLRELAEEGPAE
jgi:GNAT superfamily N-acetyltransferase